MVFLNNYTAVIVQIKGSKYLDHVREVILNYHLPKSNTSNRHRL